MNYLLNESAFNLIEDLKMRLLSIEDEGYRTRLSNYNNTSNTCIRFIIDRLKIIDGHPSLDPFSNKYLITDLEGIVSFMEHNTYKCNVEFDQIGNFDQFLSFEDFKKKDLDNIIRLKLEFKI